MKRAALSTKSKIKEHAEEEEMITACALRFDGYRYLEQTSFDATAALGAAWVSDKYPANTLELMAMFFVLQRMVFKYGQGVRSDGPEWRLLRELFLRVAREPVPPEYELEGPCQTAWRREYVPRLQETVAFMSAIHRRMRYRRKIRSTF